MALGLIGACALFGVQTGRVVQAQEDPASRALAYLRTQQQADGSIPESGGGYADSELYAIASAADGFDPNALTAASGTSVMSYLAANAAAACTVSDPGACGELIQAVVAAGGDPTAFGGEDLLATLAAGYDPVTGEYGNGEAFTQALAIQGLVAAGTAVPAAAVTFLVGAQDSDGGWDYEDVKDDTADPYDTSDTNSTAMVLMAMDAAGKHSRDASALAWLATQQDTDGGFQYQAGPYSAGSDPDSTALVVQAIVATGGDPFAAGWSTGGFTPLAYLEATQDADGGYTYPGNPDPDAFTTSEVPLALLLQPYPIRATFSAGFTPAREDQSILGSLLYLQTKQAADGSIAESYADSELFAISAAADGYDPNALTAPSGISVMTYLADSAGLACTVSDPGACGELIQAVVAAGGHPTSFGGQDLLTTMDAAYGATTGVYTDGSGVADAFTQSLAIQALVASGGPSAAPDLAVSFLASTQDADGGFEFETGWGSDTNSTAMALMALDAAGDRACDAAALAWLATQQESDGGFRYQAGPHSLGSDPDSTALVVQAIVATGADPYGTAWTAAGGSTPLGYLESTQGADGGYTFPGNAGPDAFTTSEVTPALERLALPVAFDSRQWYVPGAALGTPASPSASPTPTPTPSSGPPAGVITPAPSAPAGVSLGSSLPAGADPSGGSPPALLVYGLVALGVALAVGAGRLALAARR
jgi:prenyltransferase beta subunit